jgi:hypothetical protein
VSTPDPRLLAFAMEQAVESQSDILGALRFCERQLLEPGGELADVMTGTARVLAVIGRLVEYEMTEMEKFAGGNS